MGTEAWIVGTAFGQQSQRSFHDLARAAYLAVLADAGLGTHDASLIEQAWAA